LHPVLFEIPGLGLPLRSFGLVVAGGFLVALWLWGKLLARYGDDPANDPARGSQTAMWILIGLLLGARLMYAGVEVTRYLRADVTPAVARFLEADGPKRAQLAAQLLATSPPEAQQAQELSVGYDLLHDPLQLFFIWQGGLVMYGGLFGAVLLGLWSARKNGLRPWNALDTGLVAGFFGQAIGRWG
jgi:prolipoprotein diacylglyceryltransferase